MSNKITDENLKDLTATLNTNYHKQTNKKAPDISQLKNTGVFWEMIKLIVSNSSYPQGIFALAGSISLASLIIGNRYKTEDGLYGNLYSISIGPSGCGKDAPRSSIKETAKTLDLAESVPDSIASAAGLEDYLGSLNYPEALLLIDEFGKFLQLRSVEEFGITGVLLKLYTSVNSTYIKRIKAGQPLSKLNNPFVSLHGTTTEEAILSSLSEADSECGWLGRFLFFSTNTARPEYQKKQPMPTPESIINWYNQLNLNTTEKIVVSYTENAEEEISQYQIEVDNHLRSDTINPVIRSASVRLVEMMKKLTLIFAVSKNPLNPVIDTDDVNLAIAIVENSKSYVEDVLAPIIENGGVSSLESRQLTTCLKLISRATTFNETQFLKATKRGFMPKRMLLKKMNIRSKAMDIYISTLKDRGDIYETKLTEKEHGINCEVAYCVLNDST